MIYNIGSNKKCLSIYIIYCHYKIVRFGYLINIITVVLSKYNRKIILQH